MKKINVRRWLYGLIDTEGTKHREVIYAASKNHARAIIETRIEKNAPLVDRTGHVTKDFHAKRDGRIVCMD